MERSNLPRRHQPPSKNLAELLSAVGLDSDAAPAPSPAAMTTARRLPCFHLPPSSWSRWKSA